MQLLSVQSDHNYKNQWRQNFFSFMDLWVHLMFAPEMLPGFTEWCWGKYDGVQNIYRDLEERIEIHSWQSSHWWKWSAAWTHWFEVFYMSLLLFHYNMICHHSLTYYKFMLVTLQIYWEADPISYRFHIQGRIHSCRY